jgi:hypothetical protein
MPMQIYVDESGGTGQGNTFVMAGWLSDAVRWTLFEREWRDCLQCEPRISYFKMHEAASLRGEFRGFSPRGRDEKLLALARIIRRRVAAAIHCTVDLDGFAETIAHVGKPYSDPYFWPFHITIMAACYDLYERGHNGPFEIVFDENAIFGRRARKWFPVVRAIFAASPEALMMPEEPRFGSDLTVLPLQASDMLAWLLRRTMSTHWQVVERMEKGDTQDLGTALPGDFSWLVSEELGSVPMSPHAQFMTKSRLKGIIEKMNALLREGLHPESVGPDITRLLREAQGRNS